LSGEVLLVLRTPGVGILLRKVVDAVRERGIRPARIVGLSGRPESGRAGVIFELRGTGFRGGQTEGGEPVANGASMTVGGSANPMSSSCWKEKSEPDGVVKTAALLPRRLNGLLKVEDVRRLTRFELSLVLAGVSMLETCVDWRNVERDV